MSLEQNFSSLLTSRLPQEEVVDWMNAYREILNTAGHETAQALLQAMHSELVGVGASGLSSVTTPFRNTIHHTQEASYPGEPEIEARIRHIVRWNALVTVLRANKNDDELGGHVSTFSSAATLYDVGLNHFFRGATEEHEADLVYYQGHSSPGIYARAFTEGRLSEEQMNNFRREVDGKGLSSYPHPWLMPDFWQFPTVSMGLGPIQAIYQAHVMKYLDLRGDVPIGDRKIWCFLGDGECDEPESLGALSLASRESLGHLHFVINCNLQRLDGPVRGNSKIVQELEGVFRGAGWNVIKVVWGRHWDPLFDQDNQGHLQQLMDSVVDGELQNYKAKGGAYTRENFFNRHPATAKLVEQMSDDDIYRLNRGGHDPFKVYNAYKAACDCGDQPSVILAMTTKGYGIGSREADNDTHQVKKLNLNTVTEFAERFDIPVTAKEIDDLTFYKPEKGSAEDEYLQSIRSRRGDVPARRSKAISIPTAKPEMFKSYLTGSGDKSFSTTSALVRMITDLLRDENLSRRVVPIVPDEARTFGLEGLFRTAGIYSAAGQLYSPEDAGQLVFYNESKDGIIMEEGINEAGAISAWIAQATSYSTHNHRMIPIYMFYSMFGFQRVMDLAWAAADSRAGGFLIGAIAGRTTLNGEGLQHQDGHSHLMAAMIPNCKAYDPASAGELAVIMEHGTEQMCGSDNSDYYYITVYNERVIHAPLSETQKQGVLKGAYVFQEQADADVVLCGSGSMFPEVLRAAEILGQFDIKSRIVSVTSYPELRREALSADFDRNDTCWVRTIFHDETPVVAVSDYMAALPDSIRNWVKAPFRSLGTDGFGRSDSREQLRKHFGVNAECTAVAALDVLIDASASDGEKKTLLETRAELMKLVESALPQQYAQNI